MTLPFQPPLDFEAVERVGEDSHPLVLALDGYEGPLHLLLDLARRQKVDLRQISVARLADQYLAFVETQRDQFALAADYLVMAAWLAYLKSRLLVPKAAHDADEAPAEELAEALAFRLAKLDAMRNAGEALQARPQLNRDVFPRGMPEAPQPGAEGELEGGIYELMAAYASARERPQARRYTPQTRIEAYPIEAARARLRVLLHRLADWTPLSEVAPMRRSGEGPARSSFVASTFSAGLEMSKDGALELRQTDAFATLYLRARRARMAP